MSDQQTDPKIESDDHNRSFPDAELRHRFGYHAGTPETILQHRDLRLMLQVIARDLDDMLPPSREKSLAFTALQEAGLWAHAAIAMQDPVVDE